MIGLMHEAEPYGHLVLAGRTVDYSTLAAVIGVDAGEVKRAVKELESRGVFSRTENGVIYSRRMIRDENRRETLSKNGRKGGNPSLVNKEENQHQLNQGDNQEVKASDKPHIPEARGFSKEKGDPPTLAERLWGDGLAYLLSTGMDEKHARSQLGKWRKLMGDPGVVEAISHCQANGISDPVAYIEAASRNRGGIGRSSRESDEERLKREREEFIRRRYGGAPAR